MRGMLLGTAVAGAAAVAFTAVALAPRGAGANPYFAEQTRKPCSACHYGGREREGRGGLNPAGQRFLQCGYHFC